MNRTEAKDLFRNDKDSYGKPKGIMKKIDKIFDDFESEKLKLKINLEKSLFSNFGFNDDAVNVPNQVKIFKILKELWD